MATEEQFVKRAQKFTTEDNYLVNDPIQIKFLENTKFCSKFKDYLETTFAVKVDVQQPEHNNNKKTCNIQISTKIANQLQSCRNEIENLFRSIKKKTYSRRKIQSFLTYHRSAIDVIESILVHKKEFVVMDFGNGKQLFIHYFQYKKPFYTRDVSETINSSILEITLILPQRSEQTINFSNEFDEKIQNDLHSDVTENMISIRLINLPDNSVTTFSKQNRQQQLRIFGYQKVVQALQPQYQDLLDRHKLKTFKTEFNQMQIDYLTYICPNDVAQIQRNYQSDGVKFQIKSNEFVAPTYLETKIRDDINSLLLNVKSTTFQTIEIFQALAEKEIQRLQYIAHRNHCHINQYDLKIDDSKIHIVPQATSLNSISSSKFLREQSSLFCSSPDIMRTVAMNNGSINICIGDITKQKVDAIILPSTSNGFREKIIEQSGLDINSLKYDPTQMTSNIRFIATSTNQFSCKNILFSNWTAPMHSSDTNLRRSTQNFISKSIQYAMTQLKACSIAFALSDMYDKEDIFTDAVFQETRTQIERSSKLHISFIFLSEQQTLFNLFSTQIEKLQGFLQFSFPTTTLQIILVSSSGKSMKKCKSKIQGHLEKLMSKSQLQFSNDNSVFQQWHQHMINTFYLYCKERYVLPIILSNNNKLIEFCGPIERIHEVKEKYKLLDALQKQISTQVNPNHHLVKGLTCYNILIVYNKNDQTRCERLTNRLIDDGFSVLMVDIVSAIGSIKKCDCILICLSHYTQDDNEAIKSLVHQADPKVVLVKIQFFNTSVSGWLHDYMIGKICYNLYGSDNYFNLEYDKLIAEVLNITKPGHIWLLNSTVNRSSELIAIREHMEQQRKQLYNKKVKKLIKLGKISADDLKDCVETLKALISEQQSSTEKNKTSETEDEADAVSTTTEYTYCPLLFERWLKKAPNVYKQNIPPFTITGDINDAVFPLPEDVNKDKEEFIRKHFVHRSTFSAGLGLRITSYAYGKVPVKMLCFTNCTFGIPSTKISHKDEQLRSTRFGLYYARATLSDPWKNFLYSCSVPYSEDEIKRREQLDNDLSIMKDIRDMKTQEYVNKYPAQQQQILKTFKNFMKAKEKNTMTQKKLNELFATEKL